MDIINLFKPNLAGIRKSHVKNLITIAMADGTLESQEWDFLVSIAKTLGATEDEIQRIQQHPESVKFIPPKLFDERVEQISDLVAVMTIDGSVNPREIELCKKIALKLDILPRMVDDIVDNLHSGH